MNKINIDKKGIQNLIIIALVVLIVCATLVAILVPTRGRDRNIPDDAVYTVNFLDWNNEVIKTESVKSGNSATSPTGTPLRPATERFTYDFVGWDTAFDKVTGEMTITATYSETPRTYTVSFVNYDGTALKSQAVAYGLSATAPTAPTKVATPQQTFTFTGWDKDLTNIKDDVTIKATFSESIRLYNVSFVNFDGTNIKTEAVAYGSFATAPSDPTRLATAQYTYAFSTWDKAFDNITADLSISATYENTLNAYAVSFLNYDGTSLKTETVLYGSSATAPQNPTKSADLYASYTFSSWDKAFNIIIGELTVTAEYTAAYYKNNVTFINWNDTELKVETVNYGSSATAPSDPTRPSTPKYTYTFTGWDKAFDEVLTDLTVKALYSQTIIPYSVTFQTNGGSSIDTVIVAYEDIISAPSNNPENAPYFFGGWYSDAECTILFSFATLITANITLYAKWVDGSVGLKFELINNNEAYQVSIGICVDTDIIVPSSYLGLPVLKIKDSGFNNQATITSIILPSSLTIIGTKAFNGCTSLTSLALPSGVISIDKEAFAGCTSLVTINLPDSLTTIGMEAFKNCTALLSLIIPKNTTSIGSSAFSYMTAPLSFAENSTITAIGVGTFRLYYGNNIPIPSSVTTIGNYAFQECRNISTLTLPSNLTSIGDHAFFLCLGLIEITLPSSLTSIDTYAFTDCINLTYVYIDKEVPPTIADNSFSSFRGATSEILPNVKIIVPRLSLEAYKTASGWATYESRIFSRTFLVSFDTNGGTAVAPIEVASNDTFLAPTAPTKANFGFSSWYTNSELTTLYNFSIPVVADIILYAKWYIVNQGLLYTLISGKSEYSVSVGTCTDSVICIPEYYNNMPVTKIANNGFYNKSITSIILPNTLKEIGVEAFKNCSTLAEVKIPKNVTTIGANAFYAVTGTVSFTEDSTITAIGDYAFYYYRGTYIVLPSLVTTIGAYAFYLYNVPSNYLIPEGITSIGNYAYQKCTATSIVLPSTLTYIGDNVFYGTAVSKITLLAEIPPNTIGISPLQKGASEYDYILTVIVSRLSYHAYTTATTWKKYKIYRDISIVSYESNGGSVVDSKSTDYNTVIPEPTKPVKLGFTFVQWCTDEALTLEYAFNKTVKTDITLYAKWAVATYTVNFVNADDTSIIKLTVTHGDDAVAPADPVKKADQQYTYTFLGWDKPFTNITQSMVVCPLYEAHLIYYNVIFMNEGVEIFRESVGYGLAAIGPSENPTKEQTAQYTYTFTDWNISFQNITKSITVNALFSKSERSYTITFINYDDTVVSVLVYKYGLNPIVPTVTKPETEQFTYTRKGWEPVVSSVTKDATYKALYTEVPKTFRVRFLDWKDELIATTYVEYGKAANLPNQTQTKPTDVRYSYVFERWNIDTTFVTAELLVKPIFIETPILYTVYFQDLNYNNLKIEQVEYDNDATPPLDVPTIQNSQRSFTFHHWGTSYVNIKKDTSVVAVYTEKLNVFTILYLDWDEETVLRTYELEWNSDMPPSPSPAPKRPNTAQYLYTFIGWSSYTTKVWQDEIITPKFERVEQKYYVYFQNWNGDDYASKYTTYGQAAETPVSPIKPSDAQYSYVFTHWSPDISFITGVLTTYPQYDAILNIYEVTFLDWDDAEIATMSVDYGSGATAPTAPTREAEDDYIYTFNGWDKTFDNVTETLTVKATFRKEPKICNVTFVDWDASEISFQSIAHGSPATAPSDPTRDQTTTTIYTFNGWDKSYDIVTNHLVVTATYLEITRKYTVYFVDDNDDILKTELLSYNASATAPANPTKASTVEFTFTFTGWDNTYGNITSDLTVKATYSQTVRQYTVIFVNDNNFVLKSEVVDYNCSATAPTNPIKNSTTESDFTFAGWDKDFSHVTSNIKVAAVFSEAARQYNVFFVNYDNTTLKLESVGYGSSATAPTTTPTKPSSQQYAYTFSGWDKPFDNVVDNFTVKALFEATLREYIVSFLDGDGFSIKEESVAYGSSANPPIIATKTSTEQYSYTFAGWNETYDNITDNLTVTAKFNSVVRTYMFYFETNGGSLISAIEYTYGDFYSRPTAPTKSEHELGNWYSDVDLSELFNFNRVAVRNLTIYASWIYIGSDGLSFTLINDHTEYEVSKGSTTDTAIKIPSVYHNKPVTTIASNAFFQCSFITSVVIPNSIKTINNSAFYLCTSLSSIDVPNSVTSIGISAFSMCSELVSMDIPSSVTSIGYGVLLGCEKLAYLNISAHTQGGEFDLNHFFYPGDYYAPDSLTTVIIKDGASGIAINCFRNLKYLENVTMPNSVTYIGNDAFSDCTSLSGLNLSTAITIIRTNAFVNCSSLTALDLPQGLKTIGGGCFTGCKFTEIVIPSSIESINSYSFYGMTTLETVTVLALIPPDLGVGAFTTYLGNYQDGIIENLKIFVPNGSVTQYKEASIWKLYVDHIFGITSFISFNTDGGSSISSQEIAFNSTATQPSVPTKTGHTFENWYTDALLTIPYDWDTLVTIDFVIYAKWTANIYNVTFNNWDGTELTTQEVAYSQAATAPESPTKIATAEYTYTFNGWDKTFNFIAENTVITAVFVQTINEYTVMFYDWNDELLDTQSVNYGSAAIAPTTPSRPSTLENTYTFSNWDVNFDEIIGNLTVNAVYNIYVRIYTVTFVTNCESTINDVGVEYGSAIDAPTSPINFEHELVNWYVDILLTQDYNFSQIVTGNITLYAKWVFVGTKNLMFTLINDDTEYEVSKGTMDATEITIPPTYNNLPVTTVALAAFGDCRSITSVQLPNSITTLKEQAFSYCTELVTINLPSGITTIGQSAFAFCSALKSVTIPDGVTTISIGTFSSCTSLTNLIIGSGVTTIGKNAFHSCSSLTTLNIPEGVTFLDQYCFTSCSSLTTVVLPSTVNSLNYNVFALCIELQTVTIYATTPPNSQSDIFLSAHENFVVLVPAASISSYKDADYFISIASHIFGITSTVTFQSNDGSEVDSVEAPYGNAIIEPTDPTRSGYMFDGWYTDEALTVLYDFATLRKANIILYANWCVASAGLMYSLINDGTEYDVTLGDCRDTYINIPSRYNGKPVTALKEHAFSWETFITGIYIPSTIKDIFDYALYEISSLVNIDVSEDNLYFKIIDGVLFSKDGKTLVLYPKADPRTTYAIPSGVTHLKEDSMHKAANLISVTVPNTITEFDNGFMECENLVTVIFESGSILTALGTNSFHGCTSLTTINIPNSVEYFSDNIFYGCTSLENIVIPASVEYMKTSIFQECTSLISVTIEGYFIDSLPAFFFADTNETFVIYVSAENLAHYKWLWSEFADRIFAIT